MVVVRSSLCAGTHILLSASMDVLTHPATRDTPLLYLGFLFFLVFLQLPGVAVAVNQEGTALLSFKSSIKEDTVGALSNWNASDQDPCLWNGIACRDRTVVSISIPKKKLLGILHPALGSLSSLRHVNLRSNRLRGGLPPDLFHGARGLQSLVLYGNSFSGPLPPEIADLSNLQILDVSHNLMNASLPPGLLECRRLRYLDLSNNNFTGALPPGFGSSFAQLEKLNLSYNGLIGSIPGGIGNLSVLQDTVDLSHNLFSGAIPASLGKLPEKVYIDLTYNNLSGRIPQDLVYRGPTAFIGNPSLCGPPLKAPCSSGEGVAPSSYPFLPSDNSTPGVLANDNTGKVVTRRSLSTSQVIAIVVGDIAGIGLIGLAFLYCYWRATSKAGKDDGGNPDKGQKGKKECLCFRKDESEGCSENVEQLDLIVLDRQVNFDLDELLKASAFVLGKSGIGIVYKVVLEDGLTLAVRRLGEGGSQRFKEFQMEVEAIGKVRHPNIVCLKAYYWSIDEKLLIYDYVPNGNLSAAIHGKVGMVSFTPLPWHVRLKIMKGIARGMAYLHEFSPKKYVHGDLKPNNILLGANMEPFIADFGLGRLANIAVGTPISHSNRLGTEKPSSQSSDVAVSPIPSSGLCYQAPESLRTLKPSQKWDVYSYGVMLLEMITGRSPIVLLSASEMDLVRWVQVCIEEKKPLSEVLDPYLTRETDNEDHIIGLLKIALACVQTNPERRPSMRHVLDTLERLTATG